MDVRLSKPVRLKRVGKGPSVAVIVTVPVVHGKPHAVMAAIVFFPIAVW
jgi:hypothetical protein